MRIKGESNRPIAQLSNCGNMRADGQTNHSTHMTQQHTALLSASHKEGLELFAQQLINRGWNILASGGTATYLAQQKIPVTDVATIVGPPLLGHRVVTLSREIHAGLLATESPEDQAELARLNIPRIDLVYVDMYPLQQTIESGASLEKIIEGTDIGGPTMLRSGAKGRRVVVSERKQFDQVLSFLDMRPRLSEKEVTMILCGLVARAEFIVSEYSRTSFNYHHLYAAALEEELQKK